MKVEVEGLDDLLRGVNRAGDLMNDVMREILRGPFGQELQDDIRARMSDHNRTGWTVRQVGVDDFGAGGVQIGITGRRGDAKHPSSPRANARSIGVWLESGARMHLIPTRVSRYNRLSFGGRVVARVAHPGMRGSRIMQTTLRVHRSDSEALILREVERRLAPHIGVT
jgi:hypothetical protein